MLAATFALVLSLTSVQQHPPFDARVSDPNLLRYESVQKELNLSTEQVAHIKDAHQGYNAKAKRTKSWNSDKEREAVAKYLDAGQLKRLREISLQSAGPIVLICDFVAERIGADKARQDEIQDAFHSAFEDGFKPMREKIDRMVAETMKDAGNDPKEIEKRSEEISRNAEKISEAVDNEAIQRDAVERIKKMLTPTERKNWQDLQGAPFPVERFKTEKRMWD